MLSLTRSGVSNEFNARINNEEDVKIAQLLDKLRKDARGIIKTARKRK